MSRHFPVFCLLATAVPTLAVPEGFVIREFAAPPNVDYPTAITAAANGDLYVSSDKNGSLGHEKDFGSIIRCRDKDGDGQADEFTAFVPKVDSPRGGHFVGDTLYLIHPPFLSSFRDTDGDGVADEKKQLLSGLGGGIEHPRGADHTTNGVRMGIDGWLYVSVGDFGAHPALGTDGSSFTLQGGGVIRVRPDGSHVEPYALMVRNICDTAISPELDLFSRDNTNDGKGWNTRFHHHTELGDHGYPRLYQNFADEALQPLADYGGGSGTGALWLSEPGFPEEFTDALLSTDWTTGTVHYHPWKREGASFSIGQKTFEKLPRAIDIDVDGNSRLYLADWRAGGFKFAGPGKPVGMIHQVVFPGGTPAKYVDVSKAGDGDLLQLMVSASAVQRLETQRELLKRGRKPEFGAGLLAVAGDANQSSAVRTAAIFTFKQLYGADSTKFLVKLMGDAAVREMILRAMADSPGELDGVPVDAYVDALKDENPRVALQAIIGLKRLKAKEAVPAVFAASRDWHEEGKSPRLQHTAMQALVSLENIPACLAAVGDASTRKLALLVLKRIHRLEVADGLWSVFVNSPDPDQRFEILTALARLSHKENEWDLKSWWRTRPDDRGPYYEPVEWEGTAKIFAMIEKGFGVIDPARRNELLELFDKNRLPVSGLKLAGVDPALVALGAKTLGRPQLMLLAAAAKDGKRPFARRVEYYKALARAGETESMPFRLDVLSTWTEEKGVPAEVSRHVADFVNSPERGRQIHALRKLAAEQSNAVSKLAWKAMLTVLGSPLATPEVKNIVRKIVDKNPREIGFFLAITELKASGFDAQIEAGMNWDNAELANAAKAAKAAVSTLGHGGKKVFELPAADVAVAAMSGQGDLAIGERLFTVQGCVACHSIDPKAEQKGPYLGAAGAKFSRDYLIESVLDPNKVVAQGFSTSLIKLKDGVTKMGFITEEVDGVIELRDISGQVSRIRRADVAEEIHLPNSMMPVGLAAGLTVEEFTSLIEYLVSLKATGG